jgi:signal transduction histidine kinase
VPVPPENYSGAIWGVASNQLTLKNISLSSYSKNMNLLQRLTEYFRNKPKPLLILINIGLLLCIGVADYAAGYEIGISLFYLIPISFAGWFGGRRPSIIISSLSVLTIAAADFMAGKEYPHYFVELWNLLMHLGIFVVYGVVLSLLRADLDERKRLNENILSMLKIVSHDIRGPLIAIASTLKLLQRGSYGRMDDSVANTVQDLSIRVKQILGIADDCLGKTNAVDAHMKIEKHEIDLRQEVINSVLYELSNEIEAGEISIDKRLGTIPTGTILVNASKQWLKVVYRNLFQNAIKYGGHGCTIAFGYEDHGSFYRLNVYNTGTLIPEDKRSVLFSKFGRVQGDTVREGVGMGLFLTKEIINRHGGDIWYEAKHNGNDFIFTLPK